MKHNHNHDNSPSAGLQLKPVRFEFTHPTATTVMVAGTFNGWQPGAKPMHPSGSGHWLKETVLPAGTCEYRLVVDGQWMADPLPKETLANPFEGRNSILRVWLDGPVIARVVIERSVATESTNPFSIPALARRSWNVADSCLQLPPVKAPVKSY